MSIQCIQRQQKYMSDSSLVYSVYCRIEKKKGFIFNILSDVFFSLNYVSCRPQNHQTNHPQKLTIFHKQTKYSCPFRIVVVVVPAPHQCIRLSPLRSTLYPDKTNKSPTKFTPALSYSFMLCHHNPSSILNKQINSTQTRTRLQFVRS